LLYFYSMSDFMRIMWHWRL